MPKNMAVILTYPERVTPHNLEKLRQRVLNGTCVIAQYMHSVLVLSHVA